MLHDLWGVHRLQGRPVPAHLDLRCCRSAVCRRPLLLGMLPMAALLGGQCCMEHAQVRPLACYWPAHPVPDTCSCAADVAPSLPKKARGSVYAAVVLTPGVCVCAVVGGRRLHLAKLQPQQVCFCCCVAGGPAGSGSSPALRTPQAPRKVAGGVSGRQQRHLDDAGVCHGHGGAAEHGRWWWLMGSAWLQVPAGRPCPPHETCLASCDTRVSVRCCVLSIHKPCERCGPTTQLCMCAQGQGPFTICWWMRRSRLLQGVVEGARLGRQVRLSCVHVSSCLLCAHATCCVGSCTS
jgi:hypothetical protein